MCFTTLVLLHSPQRRHQSNYTTQALLQSRIQLALLVEPWLLYRCQHSVIKSRPNRLALQATSCCEKGEATARAHSKVNMCSPGGHCTGCCMHAYQITAIAHFNDVYKHWCHDHGCSVVALAVAACRASHLHVVSNALCISMCLRCMRTYVSHFSG
jgi:hypothetical protein